MLTLNSALSALKGPQPPLAGLRTSSREALEPEEAAPPGASLQALAWLSETKERGHIFEPPKNGKGRNVKLSMRAVAALRRHKVAQNAERLRVGTLWQDSGLVFPSQRGTTMCAKNLTARSFKPLLQCAGLPRSVRLHDLRHTCATILLKAGQHPKFVQELLGHANISITLDTYSHVLPGMGDGLADAMDVALD